MYTDDGSYILPK